MALTSLGFLLLLNAVLYIQTEGRPRAILKLKPDGSLIFIGENVILSCEIKEETGWKYMLKQNESSDVKTVNAKTGYKISSVEWSHSGEYKCVGKKGESYSDWSEVVLLTVQGKLHPVLRVSPSWLNPGHSVTLTCVVEVSTKDWRFYWYKTVPYKAELTPLADQSNSFEPLLDSDPGTGESSYILHGATHTAGYSCRAGRGQPVYHSYYSEAQFLWSGDQHPLVLLTVNTNRTQHFGHESVSLRCEGNSTGWKVKRSTTDGVSDCSSHWGTMTRSTCTLRNSNTTDSGVYWCESGSGEYSNAVNITVTQSEVILESPVHPVTEADSVTLHCKNKNPLLNSKVAFYKDGLLIQNGTSAEITIHAVSKSHAGLYMCKYSNGEESPESWLLVKVSASGTRTPLSDLFMVLVVFGLLLVLILFLILLRCYQKVKGACFSQRSGCRPSQGTNQSPSLDYRDIQNLPPSNGGYFPPQNGGNDACEVIKATETNEHDGVKAGSKDVTYSELEFKNFDKQKKAKRAALIEETVYSDVKMVTDPDL